MPNSSLKTVDVARLSSNASSAALRVWSVVQLIRSKNQLLLDKRCLQMSVRAVTQSDKERLKYGPGSLASPHEIT